MRMLTLLFVICAALSALASGDKNPLHNIVDLNLHISSTHAEILAGDSPTFEPTAAPTHTPSAVPTATPTYAPTRLPSAAPTRRPTLSPAAPTAAPTAQVLPVVTFNAVFAMTLASSNLTTNDKKAITDATATTLNIPNDYVTFVGATVVVRRMLREGAAQAGQINVESVSMSVTTNVEAPLVDYPQFSTNTTALVKSLTQTLSTSISNGDFNQNLANAVTDLGLGASSSVYNAQATGVVVDDVDTEPVPSEDDDGISSNTIIMAAGVVIAGIIFVAFIAAVFSLVSGFIIDQELKKAAAAKAATHTGQGTTVVVQDQDFHEVYSESNSPDQNEKSIMMTMPRGISGRNMDLGEA